jgi:crotonobetainyl-CoA:carnitine CoA-transferase CaiB-like acyl-CoA transferase
MRETSAEWAARLARADAPAAPVLGIPETVKLEQLASRDILQSVDTPHGPVRLAGSGFRLEHGGGAVEKGPATPGQHVDEVLAEAGYTPDEIAAMRRDGVV